MASFTPSYGVKIFSGASADAVESLVNSYIAGDGTMTNRRKQLTHPPQFAISGGTFYVLISYVEFGA